MVACQEAVSDFASLEILFYLSVTFLLFSIVKQCPKLMPSFAYCTLCSPSCSLLPLWWSCLMYTCKQELSCIKQLVTVRVIEPLCDVVLCFISCAFHHMHHSSWFYSEETPVCSFSQMSCTCISVLFWFVLVHLYVETVVCCHWPSSSMQQLQRKEQSACHLLGSSLLSHNALNKSVLQKCFDGTCDNW